MTTVLTAVKPAPKRLLTIGHSYVLRSNRRLAEAIQDAGNGEWQVTVAAPQFYRGNARFGDLRPEALDVGDDEKVKVVGIPVAFSNRVHFALYGTRLRKLMASGFDAIHCWEEPFILSGAQMAQWSPAAAILTFFSWQNINKSYPPPFNWLERHALARADGWVAGGTLSEQVLKERPVYRDRPYRVIGPGVDAGEFRPSPAARARVRAAYHWSDDDVPVIGYLGRFTAAKGLPLMLSVLGKLQGKWRALFVGSGGLDEPLRRWAEPYGANVQIVSTVANGEVPDYLNAMDLLCVPSQTTPAWREQFGRVLIEGFACGVCVVASDSAEIPHVVSDAGRIVAERDEDAWRCQIEALLANHGERRALGQRGLARAHANYTWPAVGAKYIEFFDTLYDAKRSPLHGSPRSRGLAPAANV
jgi:glycosyltransferase involved in cell wall biosynthesis